MKLTQAGAILFLAGCFSMPAMATPRAPMATNVPGSFAMPAPPSGFNPVTATDAQLAEFGFPPRPDAIGQPSIYATWRHAMRLSRRRITPVLRVMPNRHGPARQVRGTASLPYGNATSTTWSGYVLTNNWVTHYMPGSFQRVYGTMTVPTVTQPYGTCSGGWMYDYTWAGLDGWYNNEVLQAGIEADAYCSRGSTATNYNAWYEWFPTLSIAIQNLTVLPGQTVFVAVWALDTTHGQSYVLNLSNGQYASILIYAPFGTVLEGSSAEWVVERPLIHNVPSKLDHYGVENFTGCATVDTLNQASFPGHSGDYFVSQTAVTMLDDFGGPISYPTLLAGGAVRTNVEGSSY